MRVSGAATCGPTLLCPLQLRQRRQQPGVILVSYLYLSGGGALLSIDRAIQTLLDHDTAANDAGR
jgi:hypothetical protein